MRKKRGYKRDIPKRLLRDYKLFAIACEGGKREPEYFSLFEEMSERIKVDIIEDKENEKGSNKTKSAPKWVLDRAVKYIEKEGLIDEDDLWFVMDTDRWKKEQLHNIAAYCQEKKNWHIILSNPCFEVWLYLHKKSVIPDDEKASCKKLKTAISHLDEKGYHPFTFIPSLSVAIQNAQNIDRNPNHFMPEIGTTKVYLLGEALIQTIGLNDFESFVKNQLPKLINDLFKKDK